MKMNTLTQMLATSWGHITHQYIPTTGLLLCAAVAGASSQPNNSVGAHIVANDVRLVKRLTAIAKHLPIRNFPVTSMLPATPPGTYGIAVGGPVTLSRTPDEEERWMQERMHNSRVINQGEQQLQSGDVENAITTFQSVLNLPAIDQNAALRGLAHCAAAAGDLQDEVSFLRPTIYSNDPSVAGTVFGDGYRENNIQRLMEFALALNQTGQSKEAASVYNRTIGLFNYDGVQQRHKVMLPLLGDAPGQVAYTSQKLQANAHLAISVDMFEFTGYGSLEPLTHLQQALTLAPDSAAANYYMGHYLYGKNAPGAKAFLEKSMRLGGSETTEAAKDILPLTR